MNKIFKMYSSSPYKNMDTRKNTEQVENPLEDETKRSYNQISGLKLSGNHQYIIDYEGKQLYIANSGYVALLEKRLREQLKEIRELQNKVYKLEKTVEKQKNKINELIMQNNRKDYSFF